MTARDMQITFQQHLEGFLNYQVPPLISDDIFHFINESINEYVIEHFRQFEQNQRVSNNISTLIVKDFHIGTIHKVPTWSNEVYLIDSARFPDNFAYLLDHRSVVEKANSGDYDYEVISGSREASVTNSYVDFTTSIKSNSVSQHDDIRKLLADPFHTTHPDYPLTTISEHSINVYTISTFIVSGVIIDYIKEPLKVSVGTDSDLPTFTHRELVRMAVRKYVETISIQQPTN